MNKNYDLTEYVDRLYHAALAKTGDSFVAEDIAQDTFIAFFTALSRGKEPENIWNFLYAVMSNKYCDWLRNKYNKPQISLEDYPLDIEEESLDDDSEEKLENIRRELGFLAKTHREVLVRFYMHGDSIETIANDLHIPQGTVKSRLNTGRKHIKQGVNDMENYTKQSYEPDKLKMCFSGTLGLNNEPISLVDESDILTQNVLILAYKTPITEMELAKALGTPVVFIEPIVKKMIDGELMKRTDSGKVYTDFIIFTDNDRKATFERQLQLASEHFDTFWNGTEKALAELRSKDYYIHQSEHGKMKLELHFCIKVLMNAHIDVRNEITGVKTLSDCSYRKNGGRWFAMGQQYSSDFNSKDDTEFKKYGISGEAETWVKNFLDTKYLALENYDTVLGKYPNFQADYVMWLYEILSDVPREKSNVNDNILESVESFIESGILKKEKTLVLDIPILSRAEYQDECNLAAHFEKILSDDIHDVLIPIFNSGFVTLPSHLKSVPKWQQYMFCGDSVPMAVILKAKEKELFLKDVTYPVPASIMVIEK